MEWGKKHALTDLIQRLRLPTLEKISVKGAVCHAILVYFQTLNGVFASVEFQK